MSNSLAAVHPELIAEWSEKEFTTDTGQYNFRLE